MRNFMISAAALALAATGAQADPGGGKGPGNGNGNGKGNASAAKVDKGPSMKADRGPAKQADRGPSMKADRGPSKQADRGPSMQADRGPAAKADRGPAAKADRGSAAKADRGPAVKAERRAEAQGNRGNGNGNGNGNARAEDTNYVRTDRGADYRDVNVRYTGFDSRQTGIIDGCPPGLAKKNNGCTPPGLANNSNYDYRSAYYSPSYYGYNGIGDGRYYYDDGYLYRVNNTGGILGYLPLLGGALSVGNQWPSYYQPVSVPDYYREYYNLGSPNSYRYADDVLYRVDPNTSTITSIAALLTGDQFQVGQRIPNGYDVYNVPYGYQDRYYDSPDSYYRYSDGYVYQVDPTTQLIQAAIQLLT
ncbi:hypothetical protein [Tsuneonella amylolytica]|uniref:hypothetical protein n=1 Tax=Tsuneonella amylolytica TaxID=2338327 RepID=UPI000EA8FA78|nr:hypothetical protein [Tsuneonella amylolytica]